MSASLGMQRFSVRRALTDSQVGNITIALLVAFSVYWAFLAVWEPLWRVLNHVFEAVAILDIPYFSFTVEDRFLLTNSFSKLLSALLNSLAALLLSKWMHGISPFEVLRAVRARLLDK